MCVYLERVVPWLELGDVHPLAVDIVLVNVTAINGNTLVSVIDAFVPEVITTFPTINSFVYNHDYETLNL